MAARWDSLDLLDIVARNALDPTRVALSLGGDELTYTQLVNRATTLARALRVRCGLQRGDRVALLCRNRLEYFEVELGVTRAGGILVAMSWRYSAEECISVLRRSGARIAIVDAEFEGVLNDARNAGKLPALQVLVAFAPAAAADLEYDELVVAPPGAGEAIPLAGRTLDDPHEIIFTSGTTGTPKGAVWTNGGVIWNALQQILDFGIDRDSVTFVAFDLNYIGGRHQFVWGVLHRGGIVHIKESGGFDAGRVLAAIERNRVSHILLVPTMLHDLLATPELSMTDTSSLRTIMTGGAAVSTELLAAARAALPGVHIMQVYGLTEGGGTVSYAPASLPDIKGGSAGHASTHASIRIVDDSGSVLGPDAIGEIQLQAPTVCAGYWDDSDATSQLFDADWLRTGDLGLLDAEGYLFITGRKKDLIISGGMNIFPIEIEAVLERHPHVRAAAVFGMPHERWGESVCAAVELKPGYTVSAKELTALCRESLASYKKPTRIEFLTALPRTSSGKISKGDLPTMFGSGLPA
ncbi:long-chain fatty acid--CoA ligase [Cryobacterium sp. TMS1-20-1]|uniref:class I adenylate-forming enzyme family protein n=1 Tax=Cryobacterium sp. TMS1-20-1 TaxID=1259223 RepID=UPI001068DDD4|nr:AMP-binding protein [Cryobacterium sp. TMS1-20-1]TFC78887.1 long-chain fatty acid--CoA ligase [Cryobacterium sp. TMS1-20-1]